MPCSFPENLLLIMDLGSMLDPSIEGRQIASKYPVLPEFL
jgi:hypothetical protein